MPAPVLQFKRGNAGVAGTVPALRPGEPAISLNNFDFFIGIDTSVANNKFFGSHRYWGREDGTNSLKLKLVDKDGTNHVAIKAPDTVSGITTYTLPETPVDGYFLKTNSTGTLSWEQVVSNINIAADSGTPDAVSTGSTITFSGGTNVNTAVTNDTITINLDDSVSVSNLNVSVAATFASANVTDLTSGRVVLAGASGALEDSANLTFDGSTLTVDGQIVTNSGVSTFTGAIDALGGVIGNLTGTASTATTVNTVSAADNPANYYVTFVNSNNGSATAETVYTDDGIYYNPGTNTFTTQNALFTGNVEVQGTLTGTASTASRALGVDVVGVATNQNYYITLVDGSGNAKSVGVDAELLYNPNTNVLSVPQVSVGAGGTILRTTANGRIGIGSAVPVGVLDVVVPTGDAEVLIKSADSVGADADAKLTLDAGNGGEALISFNYQGTPSALIEYRNDITTLSIDAFILDLKTGGGSSLTIDNNGDANLYGSLEIGTGVNNGTLTVGTGVGITQFSAAVGTGVSTTSVPTSSAIIDYVNVVAGNVDLDFGLAADSGTASTVNTSQTLTIAGTANEIETSVSGQTITVGLPNSVTISNDLTVSGNLYVNGSTTQVNTSSLTVEDRTIELGMVDGAAPSSSTTWDLGVLFNYHDGAAKKSALVWEQNDARFKLGSAVTDGGGTGNSNPQLTVSSYAALEISDLWINNTCTGGSTQVIGCVGSELQLQNIVVDAGLF